MLGHFFDHTLVGTRLYVLLTSIWKHSSSRTANAMAFDLFIALIPMLGVAGWATSLALRGTEGGLKGSALSSLAPDELDEFLGHHFDALSASHLAPLAVLAGWWASSSAFNTMIGVFEETFECTPRSWIRQRLISLGLSLALIFFVGLAATVGVIATLIPTRVSDVLRLLDDYGFMRVVIPVGAYLTMSSFLAFLYRVSLVREKKRRVWPGAFVACAIGTIASLGFGYYAANLANYALFYGGLAVIVVLLLWLWLWSTAIMIGAEINVTLEDLHQPRRDSARPSAQQVRI